MSDELRTRLEAWRRGHEMVNEVVRAEAARKIPSERLEATLELMAAGVGLFGAMPSSKCAPEMDRFQLLRARVYGTGD